MGNLFLTNVKEMFCRLPREFYSSVGEYHSLPILRIIMLFTIQNIQYSPTTIRLYNSVGELVVHMPLKDGLVV